MSWWRAVSSCSALHPRGPLSRGRGPPTNLQFAICKGKAMTVRTRQSYMDLCRSDRPWKGRDMADLVDKIYDVEERADRASKVNATKLVQAKSDGFDVSGEGFLQKREGKWILSEPDFLTEEAANKIYARIRHTHNEYALRRHAPTHHYGGSDPLEGQEIHGLRVVDRPKFASIIATSCSGIGTRPVVALADGTFDDQDAATFRGTIGAAASIHDHTSITGSAAKLTTARSIGMTGDGTWSVSFDGSANVSGAMTLASIIAAGGPVGSATKAPQFTWDSKGRLTAVDEVAITPAWSSITSKPTTFSGLGVTMLASDIPNHASRHHWDGADPLTGQLISGLRSSDSPSFAGINISELGAVTGQMASNDFWRIKGLSSGSDSGYLEIATADNGNEPILFRQYEGPGFTTITRELTLLGSTGETTLPVKLNSPSVRVTNLSTGFVRSDSVGNLSSSSLTASELPNHASRHHWDGADPLTGQSISGLRTDSSPTFQDLNLTGDVRFGGLIGIGKNGYGGIVLRPSSGIVRFVSGESETYCTNAFSATSARFTNLSTGFVRSNVSGQLSSSPLIESDLPNHASRHQYGGVDSLSGQSISGLRTVDSPRFLNLILDGSLKFTGYAVTSYSGTGFFVETSGGDQLLKMTVADGAIVGYGCHPYSNGLELGKNAYRWRLRADDANHEVETINATEAPAGTNIYQIPSVGNYFRLRHPTSGQNKDYRVPTPSSGIGKELILTCTSDDPNGFVRVYAPSGGSIVYNGSYVTYIEFVWGRKLVLHSDGVRWYV